MSTQARAVPSERTTPGRGEAGIAPRLRTTRGRDETGGAVSLLVMLMTPVLVLAAVTAAAVPKRLAAEAAADDATRSLASLAVAWRDAQMRGHEPVDWFFPGCGTAARGGPVPNPGTRADDMQDACEALADGVLAALSARGFDTANVAGFYSSAYTTGSGQHAASLPCHAGGRGVVADAVHLGFAADWAGADWAAAQVWPRGVRIGAEAVATVSYPTAGGRGALPACADQFKLAPPDARTASRSAARRLAESLPTRTAFGP